MLIDFAQADEALCRQAIEIHEKKLSAAVKSLDELALPTIHASTELGRLEELRKFLHTNTTDGAVLTGERLLKDPLDSTLKTSCWILLDKLGKLKEQEESLFAPTDGTQERMALVQNLHDRLSGQTTITFSSAHGPDVTLTERQFDDAVEAIAGKPRGTPKRPRFARGRK